MDLKQARKFVEKQIKEFEQAIYRVESVMIPRYEKDKEILKQMRDQFLKLQALEERQKRGEEISTEEFRDAVPEQFR